MPMYVPEVRGKKSWVRKRCRKVRSWLSKVKLASHGPTTDSGTGGQKLVWQTADEKIFTNAVTKKY